MFERVVTVKYVNLKNSFICLPSSNYFKIGSCVQLVYGQNEVAYFSVSVLEAKLDDNFIGIDSYHARALGIKENELVTISEVPQLPTVKSITITPLNNDDYEVLEMLAENVQSTLLDQIRVVNTGQKFVIWIGVNINVAVCAVNIKPLSPGLIDFLTEVIIEPSASIRNKQLLSLKKEVAGHVDSVFDIERLKTITKFFNPQLEHKNHMPISKPKDHLIYRLVSLKELPFIEEISKDSKLFNVFASRSSLPQEWFLQNTVITPVICSLTLLTNDIFSEKIIYVRLCFFEDFIESFHLDGLSLEENLFVGETIFESFECELGSRVTLKYIEEIPTIEEINIHSKKNNSFDIIGKFKTYLAENIAEDVLVLNSNVVMDIGENLTCSLTFVPVEAKFCVVDKQVFKNCKYSLHEEILTPKEKKLNKIRCDKVLTDVSNFQIIVDAVTSQFCVHDNWENVLITGKPGTGKSTLLNIIKDKLTQYPKFIYTETIFCKKIKGKTMDSLFKVFSTAYSRLVLYQPSVLILDDLHVLCENITGDETSPNSVYSNRISEMLHNFLKMVSIFNEIGICAAAENTSKLNTNIYTARGSYLFKNLYSINDFTKEDRNKLLINFFGDSIDPNDLEEFTIKTDGFVMQDVVDFYNKSLFEAYKEEDSDFNEPIKVSNQQLEKALKNTCVLSLQDVQLHSPGEKNFSDIGGLHDVKKVLIESLLWPAQYANIFAKAPLRLQSGLLLYGPPGTGKTALAAAAAAHCGLRLISIKGPELLSKYIGASEQAVRDVFRKAQSVKPCILFFDEFDSLAPRRGHDNTGVTDRVVNQLLTQLDGIESLSGVCILAATSRPDLLDPALLRPGRLDKQILCPLPDQEARREILTALSKNLDLSADVDFEKISSLTEGYSGADLQAVLYTAQLSTVDHLLENSKLDITIKDPSNVSHQISQITQRHLEEAVSKTRPSLTSQERVKYEKIYARFQDDGGSDSFRPGSKATLA